eukprot:6192040-Pleurochrysis_carterae.AAC.1
MQFSVGQKNVPRKQELTVRWRAQLQAIANVWQGDDNGCASDANVRSRGGGAARRRGTWAQASVRAVRGRLASSRAAPHARRCGSGQIRALTSSMNDERKVSLSCYWHSPPVCTKTPRNDEKSHSHLS